MSINFQSFSSKNVALNSFIDSYRLIETVEVIEGYTISNGRIDMSILLRGIISRFDEEVKEYKPIPRMAFFPLTKNSRAEFKVGSDALVISIKCFPHMLTNPIFDNLRLNEFRSFEEVFGAKESEQLWNELNISQSIENYTDKLDDFFSRFLIGSTPNTLLIERVISYVESMTMDSMSIVDLAKSMRMNPRTLDRKFRALTGLSIKSYHDLIKFQQTAKEINQDGDYKHGDLMEALGSGYYDQSHFVKACKRISGVSPKELFTNFPAGFTDFFVKK